jgi:asparagine synthase (glutamine-hydrolysing)
MFSLWFGPEQPPSTPWRLFGQRFSSAYGWLAPLAHPMVSAQGFVDTSGDRVGFAVYERPATIATMHVEPLAEVGPKGLPIAKAALSKWPLHWFWIEFGSESLTIEASALPALPVFLVATGRAALASWDPLDLYSALPGDLDRDAAAHFLISFDQPYGPRTVVSGLTRLCAGYRAQWRVQEGWTHTPPQAERPGHPRILRPEADPVGRFTTMVETTIARLAPAGGSALAAEFSGGLDSTMVAAAASGLGHQVATFGLIMPGTAGEEQRERRDTSIKLFGWQDHTVQTARRPIWSSPDGRFGQERTVPWEELYYDPFEQLHRQAAADGHSILLSGLGGDELLCPYWNEKPDAEAELEVLRGKRTLPCFIDREIAEKAEALSDEFNASPIAFAQRSVMASAANSAAQRLRHGLFPVHPLITPEVVRYCHALPAEWRRERRLMRQALANLGVPQSVTHPASTEDFAELCEMQMRSCPVFRDLLHARSLAGRGLVEPSAVRAAFARWCDGKTPPEWDLHFIAIVILEATLNTLRASRRDQNKSVRLAPAATAGGAGRAPYLWRNGRG